MCRLLIPKGLSTIKAMRFFAFIFLLFVGSAVQAQKTDSLQKAVDQSAKMLDKTTNEVEKLKDSLKKTALRRTIDHNSQNLDVFLQEMKIREQKRKQQIYIRIGLVTLFLIVLVTGLARRQRMRKRP